MRKKLTLALGLVGLLVLLIGAGFVIKLGPRFIIGILRYDSRHEGELRVGDRAPDVELLALDGTSKVQLSQRIGKRPLVLILGSFTCPPFRHSAERLGSLFRRFRERAEFLTVYIREAHPSDEWQMDANEKESVCYIQPKTTAARVAIANDFATRTRFEPPLVVDAIDNSADKLYAGWPERMYVIDEQGTIVYKGKLGPFGFHPEEVEAWLTARFAKDLPVPAPAATPATSAP